jgi:hypothetical protein
MRRSATVSAEAADAFFNCAASDLAFMIGISFLPEVQK